MLLKVSSAVTAINKAGMLLVFPISNRPEPPSLWSGFFPKSKMRWEWDAGGDNRVAELWHLREELSRSSKVVYTKWYQGRATFMSRQFFVALLARLNGLPNILMPEAQQILNLLIESSPLSTKTIKKGTDLVGRFNERTYQKAVQQLWSRLLIVGFGEIDDGAFPSLAIGATELLFEDLWAEAQTNGEKQVLEACFEKVKVYKKHYDRICQKAEVSRL